MSQLCRVGDTGSGICYLHPIPTPYTVTLIAGSSDVNGDSLSACNIGSIGIASCGHSTTAIVGSSTVKVNRKGAHRVGDSGATASGPYTMNTGSTDINAGG